MHILKKDPLYLIQCAYVERYVWLVEITHQEEWRYVSMEDGAQCVMIIGIVMTLEWCVDNLDYQLHVSASQ